MFKNLIIYGLAGDVPPSASDLAEATAWAVVTCAEVHRPPVVVVENDAAQTTLFDETEEAAACFCGE